MQSKIQEYKNIILTIIQKYLPKAKVILYGSRARGDWREGSDIDVAIDMGTKIDSKILTSIINDIEESLIPVNCDIVDFHTVSDELRNEILKSGKIWQK